MDITTIVGLVLGVGAVLVAFLMEGGHISALIQIPAIILVIFGTLGAAVVTTSMSQLLNLPKLFKIILFERKLNAQQLIEMIYNLSQKSRKNGLLSLEKDLSDTDEETKK